MSRSAERCGVCPHEADQHNERGWCIDESCRCERYIPWSSMRKNIPELPTAAQEKVQAERVAGARSERLRRQLGTIVDPGLLVAGLMAACEGEPMIQSKVFDTLLQLGLVYVGQHPTSFTQTKE